MKKFDEHALEMSIMELFENEGYEHLTGKEKGEDLLAIKLLNICIILKKRKWMTLKKHF